MPCRPRFLHIFALCCVMVLGPALSAGTFSTTGAHLHGAAWAQSREEKKVQSIVKRADKLSEKIAAHESGEKKFTDRNIASLAKQVDRLADQLSEFDGIAGFEEATQIVAGLSDRLSGLEEQLTAALEATGGLTQREFDKQTKDIDRLIQQAERIVKDGESIKWASVKDDRRAQKMEKALAKLEEKAEQIVELVPGYQSMVDAVDRARAATQETRTKIDTFMTARDAAGDQLRAYFKSGKMGDDSKFVRGLSSWAFEVRRMMDRPDGELIFWNDMQEAPLYRQWAADVAENRSRLTTIQSEYAGVSPPLLSEVSAEMESSLGQEARFTAGISSVVQGQLADIFAAFDAVESLRDNGVERTRARIALADAEMARLEAALEYENLLLGKSITQPMIYGEALLIVLEGYTENVDQIKATVAEDMAAAKARLDDTITRVYDEIVRTNDVPSHRYDGSDAEALIAKGNSIFADVLKGEKEGVGAFIPDEDWYRDVGERMSGATLVKYDESRLFVTVFAKEPENRLSKWTLYVTKDHLKDDRISFHVSERSYDDPISPYRVYPAESIVGLR